jgi:hypothetical protein
VSDPSAMVFGRWRNGKKKVAPLPMHATGSVDYPSIVLPDCPPAERGEAVAAFDALCSQRPLKPPAVRA